MSSSIPPLANPLPISGEMRTLPYRGTIAFMVAMLTIHLLCPSLRFYVLRNQRRTLPFLISDLLFLLFIFCGIALWIPVVWQIVDQHQKSQTLSSDESRAYFYAPKYIELYYLLAVCFNVVLWTMKGVFLALYFALFQSLSSRWKIALYVTTAFCAVTFVLNFGLYLGYCHPSYSTWRSYPAHCNEGSASANVHVITFQFITNVSSELMIMALPFGIVRPLTPRLTRTERVGLGLVFGCAIISLSMTIGRYGVMRALINNRSQWPAYISYQELLGIAEILVSNVAFCIPSYRNFFAKVRDAYVEDQEIDHAQMIPPNRRYNENRRMEMLKINVTHDFEVTTESRAETRSEGYALGLYALGYISTPPWDSSPWTPRKYNRRSLYRPSEG